MSFARWLQDMKFSLALLGPLAGTRVPADPVNVLRDPWPGSAAGGESLVRGKAVHAGMSRQIGHGVWSSHELTTVWPASFRDWFQGFSWLRDLRELGTENARLAGRALITEWIMRPVNETPLRNPSVTGARIGAWLGHYDFFLASADETFRRKVMTRIVTEARTIPPQLPDGTHDCRPLRALKGLLAAGLAAPDHGRLMARFMGLIDAELDASILPDGWHASRSPETQFQVLRELAEMRLMLQNARIPLPTNLAAAVERMTPVLRAMRHGDGTLALFNGTVCHTPKLIDLVIARASPRGQVLARSMSEGRFLRLALENTLLLVDAGVPAPDGYDQQAHAGALSFEFSSGKQGIVVNCGDSGSPAWHKALRDAPAHSVLIPDHARSVEWTEDDRIFSRPSVTCEQISAPGALLADLSLDGFCPAGAGTWKRRFYLSDEGRDLRGEDRLEGGDGRSFVLRFHLHPDVRVEAEEHDILLHLPEETWRFRTDGLAAIEDSVWFGGEQRRDIKQIVVVPDIVPEVRKEQAPEKPKQGGKPASSGVEIAEGEALPDPAVLASPAEEPLPPRRASAVRWAFTRLHD
ncbi:heparinase II/III family protein [Acetobacter sp. AN02]|uniref:heparinase II/III family protein n=1 Tax=Acetobacter sp. AN02 TaxID=2894186 RepID=UPI0024341EA2|nr:heparinase II/III family protein [Acetobacter sp. AN02]MDG6095334.1 heparinase II/III family protein [Acetobacter sp. AN02]